MKKTNEKDNVISMSSGFTGDISILAEANAPRLLSMKFTEKEGVPMEVIEIIISYGFFIFRETNEYEVCRRRFNEKDS